jgi:hypothetical protein
MQRLLQRLDPRVLRLILVAVPAMVLLVGWGKVATPGLAGPPGRR